MTDDFDRTNTTTYDAAGNVFSTTDANRHTTTYDYDDLNRIIAVTDAFGNINTTTYDAVGNIVAETDSEGNSNTFIYDPLNRLIAETNSNGATRSYSYNAVGNMAEMVDRNGRMRAFTYDELDRQTTEIWLDDRGTPVNTINYTYDAISQLTAASDSNSAYSYTYDPLRRLKTVDNTGTLGVPNVLFNYNYDAAGKLLSVTDTIDAQLKGNKSFTYDSFDRVTNIFQSGSGVSDKRISMTYNTIGQLTEMSRYAGEEANQLVATSNYTYNPKGWLTKISHSNDNETLASYSWGYDEANRVVQFTSPDGTSNYTHDELNRLIGADHSYQKNETYSYDINGNRTNPGYVTDSNNLLISDGKYDYAYDAEGNLIKRTEIATGKVTELSWDYRNRLTEIITYNAPGDIIKQARYSYDVNNRRISKSVDPDGVGSQVAITEYFVYDGDNIALSFDGESKQNHRYLYGTGIDQILADENARGEVLWSLKDKQSTVRELIDSEGTILNRISYDSFGNITAQTNPDINIRFSYTGRELDEETGLYYYRARYYDPSIGRFISEDPIRATNLYTYVDNRPLDLVDPTGKYGQIAMIGGQPQFSRSVSHSRINYTSTNPVQLTTQIQPRLNSMELVYRSLGLPQGLRYNVYRTQGFPIFNNVPTFEITNDLVSALIARDRNQTTPPVNIRQIPIGGRLPSDDTGHIIPNILGGSNQRRIRPFFSDNFMSQNQFANQEVYNDYGIAVDRFLNYLDDRFRRARESSDPCNPDNSPQIRPFLELEITLFHPNPSNLYRNFTQFHNRPLPMDDQYPFRPTRFVAKATFAVPNPERYNPPLRRRLYTFEAVIGNSIGGQGGGYSIRRNDLTQEPNFVQTIRNVATFIRTPSTTNPNPRLAPLLTGEFKLL